METEWFLDTNDTCLLKHDGVVRNLQLNFTFTQPGQHNVTTVAANTVTRTFDWMMVTAYYRLNGFNITTSDGAVGTTEQASFRVTLSSTADKPMGTLRVNMTYGDGQEESLELDSKISDMEGAGYVINHQYAIQGNYSASAVIYTEIDTMNFTFDVYIWDRLTVTVNSVLVAKVGEIITFDFVNPPNSGFMYIIDFGDGNTTSNNESAWYSSYSAISIPYSYSTDEVFNLTMTAWNMFYASVCSYFIIIQHIIPDTGIALSPATDKIPIPDGVMNFTLTLTVDKPTPTNVSCTFDFADDVELNVSTSIVYNVPVDKSFTYNTSGTRTVTFECWNLVSRETFTSNIEIASFTVNDFAVTYQSPVLMNTTLSEEINEDYPKTSNIMKVFHNPINTTFFVDLLGCSRMPPDVYFTWDFGDDKGEERELVSFTKDHQFDERGTFSVSVKISDNRTGSETTKSYSIVMGVVQFTVTPQRGEISVTDFVYSFAGMEGTVTYTFDSDSADIFPVVGSQATGKYNSWGLRQASILATNGTITELVYLEHPVEADYYIDGELEVIVSNGTTSMPQGNFQLNLPPGNVQFTVRITGSVAKPYINCSINLGDLINSRDHFVYGNITADKPLELTTQYYTLGNHSLTVNCFNFVSNTSIHSYVDVFNECFTRDGIFDRQYSHVDSAMKAYTSVDTDLSSRMGVICIDKQAGFDWTVQRVVLDENNTETRSVLDYVPPNNPLRGSMRFQRGKIEEGYIYVALNVSLDGTWIHEFMFVNFIKPPPYAYIVGGNKKSAKFLKQTTTVDALTKSYDSEKGIGGNDNLSFNWTCHM